MPDFAKDGVPQRVFAKDVAIVGGCGHVGLPLGLALADAGCSVICYDIDAAAVDRVRGGTMPFVESRRRRAARARSSPTGRLVATTDPASVG